MMLAQEAPAVPGTAGVAPTMANTKAEILAAAVAAGYGTEEELQAWTKAELLTLWEEG